MPRTFALLLGLALAVTTFATASAQILPNRPKIQPKIPNNQLLFNPDVQTIWHKLGIPQGVGRFKQFRDSRINRDGLSPGKERKPPLLSLTDPKNLEPGAPEMIQAAAKMKMDQDLAPQKIKALRYICSIGCSCYNKQTAGMVEKALMEGMTDCTVSVRKAAIQAVIANNGDGCSCQGQCETCCTQGIRKLLEQIAFKRDDKGCWFEPDEGVRAMAEQALLLCPPAEETEPVKPIIDDLNDGGQSQPQPVESLNETPTPTPAPDDQSRNPLRSSRRAPVQPVAARTSFGTAWTNPDLAELEVRGIVDEIDTQRQQVSLALVRPLEFPVGAQLVLAIDSERVCFGKVLEAGVGTTIVSLEDDRVVHSLQPSLRVSLGVLED